MSAPAMKIGAAEIYWDRQDPNNTGWWLRWYDGFGVERGTEIEADEDASAEELAEIVALEMAGYCGAIQITRGDMSRGAIILDKDGTYDWNES